MKLKTPKQTNEDRVKVIERELPMWRAKLEDALSWELQALNGNNQQMASTYHEHARNLSDRIQRMQSEYEALTSQK